MRCTSAAAVRFSFTISDPRTGKLDCTRRHATLPAYLLVILFLVGFSSVSVLSQTPTLNSISPTAIVPGMQLTLTGSGFGAIQGGVTFSWGSSVGASSFTSWSDTQIVLTVPNGISPGTVTVVRNGAASNAVAYTVIPATLNSISPTALSP